MIRRHATGGSIPSLLPRLSDAELQVTQSQNNTGNVRHLSFILPLPAGFGYICPENLFLTFIRFLVARCLRNSRIPTSILPDVAESIPCRLDSAGRTALCSGRRPIMEKCSTHRIARHSSLLLALRTRAQALEQVMGRAVVQAVAVEIVRAPLALNLSLTL